MENKTSGYVLIMLMFVVTAMSIGLLVAVPIWQTQIRREKEEELIFRGKQYVEAVRIFQARKPGTFPKSIEELVEQKCLRRPFKDPMNPDGRWNIILLPEGGGQAGSLRRRPDGTPLQAYQGYRQEERQAFSAQTILVAPESALSSIRSPQVLGVVSSSTLKSFRIYNDQESYDKWLFFYGYDPKQPPEIVYYGRSAK